jgi:2-oxoglutarate ferredoxin oxidoreductase subunit beta
VDWIPESLYQIVSAAFKHRGFSFVRILQRCPEFVGNMFEPWVHDPQKMLMLTHPDGIRMSAALQKIYRNEQVHDPSNMDRAREVASIDDPIPVGILYRNGEVPCYEDLRHAGALRTAEGIRSTLEGEFDKFTVWPQ